MKTNGSTDGSLELLLDTICNMFGGITLVTILLAVLSSVAPKEEVTEPDKQQHTQEQINKEKLSALEKLEREVKKHEQQQYVDSSHDIDDLLKQLSDARSSVTSNEMARARAAIEIERVTSLRAQIETDIHGIEQKITAAQAAKPPTIEENRDIRLPRLRAEEKRFPVFLALKGQKLYEVSSLTSSAGKRDYSSRDVYVSKEPGGLTIIETKPNAGVPVNDNFKTSGLAKLIQRNIDKHIEYLSLAVYPDSYREAVLVIAFLCENNFRYTWIQSSSDAPMEIVPGDSVDVQ